MPAPPVDPAYLAALNAAEYKRSSSLNALTQQATQTQLDYVNPNDPFSKASLLKTSYDRARRQSAQSMGARGQLYSGAFQNQQDYVNRQQLQAEDQLSRSLQNFLAQNQQAQTQAQSDYLADVSQAESDRMGRVLSNPNYTPTVAAAAVKAPVAAKGIKDGLYTEAQARANGLLAPNQRGMKIGLPKGKRVKVVGGRVVGIV